MTTHTGVDLLYYSFSHSHPDLAVLLAVPLKPQKRVGFPLPVLIATTSIVRACIDAIHPHTMSYGIDENGPYIRELQEGAFHTLTRDTIKYGVIYWWKDHSSFKYDTRVDMNQVISFSALEAPYYVISALQMWNKFDRQLHNGSIRWINWFGQDITPTPQLYHITTNINFYT